MSSPVDDEVLSALVQSVTVRETHVNNGRCLDSEAWRLVDSISGEAS